MDNLSNDNFTLHLLLDEYIAANVGNTVVNALLKFINEITIIRDEFSRYEFASIISNELDEIINIFKKSIEHETTKMKYITLLNKLLTCSDYDIKTENSGLSILKEVTLLYKDYTISELEHMCLDQYYEYLIKQDNVFIDLGYNNIHGGNHFIGGYITKENKNTIDLVVINSGDGVENHDRKNKLFNCVMKFKNIDQEVFHDIIREVLIMSRSDYSGTSQSLYAHLTHLKNIHVNNELYYMRDQYSGSCTFYGMHYFVYYYLVNKTGTRDMFDIFDLDLKKNILRRIHEVYIDKNITNQDMCIYHALMIKMSVYNIDVQNILTNFYDNIKKKHADKKMDQIIIDEQKKLTQKLNYFNLWKKNISSIYDIVCESYKHDINKWINYNLSIDYELLSYKINTMSNQIKQINFKEQSLSEILNDMVKPIINLQASITHMYIYDCLHTITINNKIIDRIGIVKAFYKCMFDIHVDEAVQQLHGYVLYVFYTLNEQNKNILGLEKRVNNLYYSEHITTFNFFVEDKIKTAIVQTLLQYMHYTRHYENHHYYWVKLMLSTDHAEDIKTIKKIDEHDNIQNIDLSKYIDADIEYGILQEICDDAKLIQLPYKKIINANDVTKYFLITLHKSSYWKELYEIINLQIYPKHHLNIEIPFGPHEIIKISDIKRNKEQYVRKYIKSELKFYTPLRVDKPLAQNFNCTVIYIETKSPVKITFILRMTHKEYSININEYGLYKIILYSNLNDFVVEYIMTSDDIKIIEPEEYDKTVPKLLPPPNKYNIIHDKQSIPNIDRSEIISYIDSFNNMSIMNINNLFSTDTISHDVSLLNDYILNININTLTYIEMSDSYQESRTNYYYDNEYNNIILSVFKRFDLDKFSDNISSLSNIIIIYFLMALTYFRIDTGEHKNKLSRYLDTLTKDIVIEYDVIKNADTVDDLLILLKIFYIIYSNQLWNHIDQIVVYFKSTFTNHTLLHKKMRQIISSHISYNNLLHDFMNKYVTSDYDIINHVKTLFGKIESYNIQSYPNYIQYNVQMSEKKFIAYKPNYDLPTRITDNFLFIDYDKKTFNGIYNKTTFNYNITFDGRAIYKHNTDMYYVQLNNGMSLLNGLMNIDNNDVIVFTNGTKYDIIFYKLFGYNTNTNNSNNVPLLITIDSKERKMYYKDYEIVCSSDISTLIFKSWVHELDQCLLLKKNDYMYKLLYLNEVNDNDIALITKTVWNKCEPNNILKSFNIPNTYSIVDIHYTGLFCKFDTVNQCNILFIRSIAKQKLFHIKLLSNQFVHYNYKNSGSTALVQYMIDNNIFGTPFNYYYSYKIEKMIKNTTSIKNIIGFKRRNDYYPNTYKYYNNNTVDPTQVFEFKFSRILSCIEYIYTNINDTKNIINMFKKIDSTADYNVIFDTMLLNKYDLRQFIIHHHNDFYKLLECKTIYDTKNKLSTYCNDAKCDDDIVIDVIKDYDKKMLYLNTKRKYVYIIFEIIFGSIIRQNQHNVYNNIMSEKDIYNVHQLIMGGGKSSVILPLLSVFNYHTPNTLIVVPIHLINQTYINLLKNYSPIFEYNNIEILNITREPASDIYMTGDEKNKDIESEYKKYFSLDTDNKTNVISKIMIVTDTSIKAFKLNLIEKSSLHTRKSLRETLYNNEEYTEGEYNKEYTEGEYNEEDEDEYEREARREYSGGGIYDDNTIYGIDETEIDDYVNPDQKNRTSFKIKNNDVGILSAIKCQSFVIIDEIDSVLNPYKSDLNYPLGNQVQLKNHELITDYVLTIINIIFDTVDIKILDSLTDRHKSEQFVNNVLKQISNYNATEEYNIFMETYVLDIKKKYSTKNIKYNLIEIYYKVYNMIIIALSMSHNKDYGFGDIDPKYGIKNYYTAIPYAAVNTPVNGSEYNDIILNIILTCLLYYRSKLRYLDAVHIINIFRTFYNDVRNIDVVNTKYSDIIKLFDDSKSDITFEYLLFKDNTINTFLEFVNTHANIKHKLIALYLKEYIYPTFMKVSKEYLNISFTDIVSNHFTHLKTGFSGTINIDIPVILNEKYNFIGLKKDNYALQAIENAINMSRVEIIQPSESNDITMLKYFMDNKYDVLIDAGAYFKSKMSLEVVKLIATNEYYKKKKIIYMDDKDNQMYYYNENTSSLSDDVDNNDICIYYDHKHIVGIDVKQPLKLRGLTTINYFNRYTDVSQAIFRMRNLDVGKIIIKEDKVEKLKYIDSGKFNDDCVNKDIEIKEAKKSVINIKKRDADKKNIDIKKKKKILKHIEQLQIKRGHTNDFIVIDSFDFKKKYTDANNNMYTYLMKNENEYHVGYKEKYYIQKIKTLIRNNTDTYNNYVDKHDIQFDAKSLKDIDKNKYRKKLIKDICNVPDNKYFDEIKKICTGDIINNILEGKQYNIDTSSQIQLSREHKQEQNALISVEYNVQTRIYISASKRYNYKYNVFPYDYRNPEQFLVPGYDIDLESLKTLNIYLSPVIIDRLTKYNNNNTRQDIENHIEYIVDYGNKYLIIGIEEVMILKRYYEDKKEIKIISETGFQIHPSYKQYDFFKENNFVFMLISLMCRRRFDLKQQVVFIKNCLAQVQKQVKGIKYKLYDQKENIYFKIIKQFDSMCGYESINHNMFSAFIKNNKLILHTLSNKDLMFNLGIIINNMNEKYIRDYLKTIDSHQ
jgi:hypothetical protein